MTIQAARIKIILHFISIVPRLYTLWTFCHIGRRYTRGVEIPKLTCPSPRYFRTSILPFFLVVPTGRTVQKRHSENCRRNVRTPHAVRILAASPAAVAEQFGQRSPIAVSSGTEPVWTLSDDALSWSSALPGTAADIDPTTATVPSHQQKKPVSLEKEYHGEYAAVGHWKTDTEHVRRFLYTVWAVRGGEWTSRNHAVPRFGRPDAGVIFRPMRPSFRRGPKIETEGYRKTKILSKTDWPFQKGRCCQRRSIVCFQGFNKGLSPLSNLLACRCFPAISAMPSKISSCTFSS